MDLLSFATLVDFGGTKRGGDENFLLVKGILAVNI